MSELSVGVVEVETPHMRSKGGTSPSVALTSTSLLARNAILNFLTEGWTFFILLVAMPRLVSSWGDPSFGLFSLAWVVIGYLSFLDVGVNRAATKFVSEHLAEKDLDAVRGLVRTSCWVNLFFGLLGGLFVVLLSPYLVHNVFRISGPLEREARLVFFFVGLAVPVLLVQGIFRSVLTSYQRFDWINGVNAVTMTAQWGLAVLLAWNGKGVAIVVLMTVGARLIGAATYGVLLSSLLPNLRLLSVHGFHGFFKLLKFGTWVSVSQVISPILVYLDRMLIASFVSLSAVTLYTVPFEAMTRLRIVPTSLVNTLYPAFSERGLDGHEQRLQTLYEGSVHYLLILTLPFIVVLTITGPDLLSLWMGKQFASQASIVLRILSVGVLLNCMANVPYNALQALGRPDLTGKFHLAELPFYFLLCIMLIPHWGIIGAAIANSIRISADSLLLFWAAWRFCSCHPARWRDRLLLQSLGLNALLAVLLLVVNESSATSLWVHIGAAFFGLLLYFAAIATVTLKHSTRRSMLAVVAWPRLKPNLSLKDR